MRRWVIGLLLFGLLAGCGGGDDDDREQSDSSEQQSTTTTTTTTTSTTTSTTVPPPPRIVYEVLGSGTVPVNYWIAGDRQQSLEITLPWSEEQVEEPSYLSMLVALVGSEGDVTCRIRRGDEVLTEETLNADAGPLLSCTYPETGAPPATFPP